jgi:hypothetical protein
LNVLRVLSEQTLEISKEVKDSFVPDPSLVKVVKDSTLTILFQLQIGFKSKLRKQGATLGFSLQNMGALSMREEFVGLVDLGFGGDLTSEVLSTTRAPFIIILLRVFMPYSFLLPVLRISRMRAHLLLEVLSGRVQICSKIQRSLLMSSSTLDL